VWYIGPRNAVSYIALHLFRYGSLLADYASHCSIGHTRVQYLHSYCWRVLAITISEFPGSY